MKEGENRISLGYNRNGVRIHEKSEDGRLTPRTRQMKGGESVRELRLSIYLFSNISLRS